MNEATPMVADVAIVGLGPAGTAAAITARRHGLSVIGIDKTTFPRDKCCGDGLTTGALRLLEELGLEPGAVPSWMPVRDVWVSGPRHRPVLFALPDGPGDYAVIARRSELDSALVDLAETTGADLRFEESLIDIEPDGSSAPAEGKSAVTLTTASGQIRARHVIAADGMWSPTRKLLGLQAEGYRGEWHAFRQYFTGVSHKAATELWVWFEEDLLPGYFWSFPLADGTANVGFGIQRGQGIAIQDMKRLWPDLLSRPHIAAFLGPDATPEAPHKAWPIPARLGELATHHGSVIFVGDAAAATDPMTGEGIGQALETGIAAADAIAVNRGADPSAAGRAYRSHLGRSMIKDHTMAGALSKVLAHPRAAEASVRIAGSTAWSRRHFARWLFEDYPRAVVLTPTRWQRGIFTGPGAYS